MCYYYCVLLEAQDPQSCSPTEECDEQLWPVVRCLDPSYGWGCPVSDSCNPGAEVRGPLQREMDSYDTMQRGLSIAVTVPHCICPGFPVAQHHGSLGPGHFRNYRVASCHMQARYHRFPHGCCSHVGLLGRCWAGST